MPKVKDVSKKTIWIWTLAYRPFMMGGDVDSPIKTVVEVGEAVDIGKGLKAYVILSPLDGSVHVADFETGAFIGTDLDEVKKNVADGDLRVMKKQIKDAKEEFKKADCLASKKFWGLFRK